MTMSDQSRRDALTSAYYRHVTEHHLPDMKYVEFVEMLLEQSQTITHDLMQELGQYMQIAEANHDQWMRSQAREEALAALLTSIASAARRGSLLEIRALVHHAADEN